MDEQQLTNKRGEIDFRKKLYMQQVQGENIFQDEFDAGGIEKILKDRMEKTFSQISSLQKRNYLISPYIEIGAERCQRSLVMENELGASGAAVDISYDMLKSCTHYQRVFHKEKHPIRICCDANNLPFMSDSIPFVFCYETLHHFPEPTPITQEIYRVLAPNGCFFFDEEPYKQVFHFNLYKGEKVFSQKTLARSKVRKILDHFFCQKICNEVEHGIIENDDITIGSWKKALMHFDEKEVELKASFIKLDLFSPRSYLKYFMAYLLGGNISGICRKQSNNANGKQSIHDALICPSCKVTHSEIRLNQKDELFICPNCAKKYPVKEGVLFLFSYDTFANLYPEIFDSFSKD